MGDSAPSAATGTAGAQRLIQKGAEIAGGAFASLAGTATGLVVAGPEGVLVGGAAGSSITMALRWLGQEMSSRLLGPREEQRLGYVFTLAAAEVAERINAGEQVRQDEFFSDNPSGRSEGEEVLESILMKSQREPEEKKLPYMAHLLANLAFDPEIGSHMAHQVTKCQGRSENVPERSPSWQSRGCTLPQLGTGDNRPIRSNTPSNNRRGTDTSDN